MKTRLTFLLAVAVLAAALAPAGSLAAGKKPSRGLTVVERAESDMTTDVGKKGDSPGDLLTFANPLYDSSNASKVGTDQGFCVRVVVGKSYECTWTNFLEGGQITVQGPFYDAAPSTLAIIGGTGRYAGARGQMKLSEVPGGAAYKFAFRFSNG
jgi:allene oxide cyclase